MMLLLSSVAAVAAPPRDDSGQALVVPPEQLQSGDVFHITPGEDTQLLVLSEAPLQRVAASSRRVVGYFVAPFEVYDQETPLLGCAARIPVASFATGWSAVDDVLLGPQFLDAGKYPEITFELRSVADARRVEVEPKRVKWQLRIQGDVMVKEKSLPVELSAELTWMSFTWATMNRFPGDLMTLRAALELSLSDLGLSVPGRELRGRMAEKLKLDLFLLANTTPPSKSLDPSISQAANRKHLKFLTALRDFDQPQEGYALGRALAQENWESAAALNRLAFDLLNEPDIRVRRAELAHAWATRANELTRNSDPALLDTLAQACLVRGDIRAAVDSQQKAVSAAGASPSPFVEALRAKLARYEALLASGSPP